MLLYGYTIFVILSLALSLSQENLLRLVHIEYSIRGQRDVLRPGRVSYVPADKGIVFPEIWTVNTERPFSVHFPALLWPSVPSQESNGSRVQS